MAKYESGRLYTTPRLRWEMPWHKTDCNKTGIIDVPVMTTWEFLFFYIFLYFSFIKIKIDVKTSNLP